MSELIEFWVFEVHDDGVDVALGLVVFELFAWITVFKVCWLSDDCLEWLLWVELLLFKWGYKCLFGVLGVDVKTSSFNAFTSACKTSILPLASLRSYSARAWSPLAVSTIKCASFY